MLPRREGNGVMIDAVAGTDERPKAAKSSKMAGSSLDALAVANTLICGLSAAACLALLAVGLWKGKILAVPQIYAMAALLYRGTVSPNEAVRSDLHSCLFLYISD